MTKSKTEWTIRVVIFGGDRAAGRDNFWLGECAALMGLSRKLAEFGGPMDRTVYEIRRPQIGVDDKIWAEQNSARLRSFGMNAVAAPAWHAVNDDDMEFLERESVADHSNMATIRSRDRKV